MLRRAIDACRAVTPFEVNGFVLLARSRACDATWRTGCDGHPPVTMPDFGGLDTDGIEAAFGE